MQITAHTLPREGEKTLSAKIRNGFSLATEKILLLLKKVRYIGYDKSMDEYEQRKLRIFNQLNFLQFIAGVFIPLSGLLNTAKLPTGAWIVASLPGMVSLVTLYLNKKKQHELAILSCFILYPFVTCFIYMYGMNPGTTLYFVLYGVLSVFFLKDTGYMLFCLSFSMVSYFLLAVIIKHYPKELSDINYPLFLFNQVLAIVFIFYGLYLIKRENNEYYARILQKNIALEEKNEQIEQQANRIKLHTVKLQQQAEELKELNAVKNKMFSIISHDLKAPIYGLRTLFENTIDKKIKITELKQLLPDVQNDLNYVAGLMENLLQWAKAQMKANKVFMQKTDLHKSIFEVVSLLYLQAKAKQIKIVNDTKPDTFCQTDRDMIGLVIRNLVSNAIKFTPENGTVCVGVTEHCTFIEVYVKDTGTGISNETIKRISSNDFYSTKGTASESGTGLGLMLCREFLERNGSMLHIESETGKGSVFSFSLQRSKG